MLFFNANHGYLDGILRGYKSGLITRHQYSNFTQCETIEDMKVQLTSATDYGEVLQDLSGPVKPGTLSEKFKAKFVQDFTYLKCNATSSLVQFLDFITYEYMIDNVVLIISGAMKGEDLDREALLAQCNPLGLPDLLPALTVSRSLADLYNTVLIDTPLGPYFKQLKVGNDELNEMNLEILRLGLWRAYLEDFERWCREETDSATSQSMSVLLGFEADRRTLNIAINAVGTGLPREARVRLFPRIGKIYQSGLSDTLANVDDLSQIRSIIESSLPEYRPLVDAAIGTVSDHLSISDQAVSFESLAAEREVDLCRDAFLDQFSFAPFYAWCKLREQERRNVVWIAECIAQGQKENIHNYIPIF